MFCCHPWVLLQAVFLFLIICLSICPSTRIATCVSPTTPWQQRGSPHQPAPPRLTHTSCLGSKALLLQLRNCSLCNRQGSREGAGAHTPPPLRGPCDLQREKRVKQRKRNEKDHQKQISKAGERKAKREIHVEKDWDTETQTDGPRPGRGHQTKGEGRRE